MKSHTGAIAVIADFTKQKTNACSFTKSKLNGIGNKIGKVIWMKKLLDSVEHDVRLNMIY
jgi:hypothetical protein